MAGVSAGEVFVNLVIKGEGVQPALAAASARVKEFGKGISAASVATGMLIADAAKMAFNQLSQLASKSWSMAMIDPRTAADIQALNAPLNGIMMQLENLGVTVLSIVLPALKILADQVYAVSLQITEGIKWLESFGAIAALQTGDIGLAFQILWKNMQLVFLQGSSATLAIWDNLTLSMQAAWDQLAISIVQAMADAINEIGALLNQSIEWIGAIAPALQYALEPIDKLAKNLSAASKVIDAAAPIAAQSAKVAADDRASAAYQRQQILQAEIDSLRRELEQKNEQAIKARDVKRVQDAAVSGAEAIAKVQQTGLAGTFAIGASGGNVMYQTQKDMLRELKEQKDLARQQLEEQRKLNQKDGVRFK